MTCFVHQREDKEKDGLTGIVKGWKGSVIGENEKNKR